LPLRLRLRLRLPAHDRSSFSRRLLAADWRAGAKRSQRDPLRRLPLAPARALAPARSRSGVSL